MSIDRIVEAFIAVSGAVIGLSHLLQRQAWADVFRRLHQAGRPGAFLNGAMSLVPGAAIVAGHNSWAWPGVVITMFGWLMVAKAAVSFLVPDRALRSMQHGADTPSTFAAGGALMLAISAWAAYCAFGVR
jgi:multisubunit Na+/H+ antiporter MnhG subunit